MKAQKIYEKMGFERKQDPKYAMEIGAAKAKKKLIDLTIDPRTWPTQPHIHQRYDYMIKVLKDSRTKVTWDDESHRFIITLPPSMTNAFFFEILIKNIGREHNIEGFPMDNPEDNTLLLWYEST